MAPTLNMSMLLGAFFLVFAAVCDAAVAPTYQQIILKHHNIHRSNHSSPYLKWGPQMTTNAQAWAKQCKFEHNTSIGGQSYGQNLMAGLPASSVGSAVSDWWYNNELPYFKYYGQDNPDFSTFGSYGHFSQVVWANTQTVGCYTQDCSKTGLAGVSGNVPPYLTVCNYWPPGNFGGQWAANVKKPKGMRTITGSWNLQT